MLKQRLEKFLNEKCGLSPSQVPSVLSVFVAVKWVTWAGFVAGGVKFRPFKRMFEGGGRRFDRALIDNEGVNSRFAKVRGGRSGRRRRRRARGLHSQASSSLQQGKLHRIPTILLTPSPQ